MRRNKGPGGHRAPPAGAPHRAGLPGAPPPEECGGGHGWREIPQETRTQIYFRTHSGFAFREKPGKQETIPPGAAERLSHVRIKKYIALGG